MRTAVLHQDALDSSRLQSRRCLDAKQRLINAADDWLIVSSREKWSVTLKSTCAPSGKINDYHSKAPYWFPSDTADGLPYIRKDGVINLDALTLDKVNKVKVFQSCYILYV